MIDKIDDIPLYLFFRRTCDADWFIQGNINIVLRHPDFFAIELDDIARLNLAADFCNLAVDCHASFLNEAVSAAS